MKFLIQELKTDRGASRFYLRLEKDGVFEGWAVPKGLPEKGSKQHLALKVGSYPLAAEEFEGRVGKGKFPPGMITVWDRGKCRSRYESDEKIVFDLSGGRVQGTYALVRFEKAGPDGWLLSRPRKQEEPKDPQKKSFRLDQKRRAARSKKSGAAPEFQPKTFKKIKPALAAKNRSSRQKYRKWKSQNRPKARLTSRFPQKIKTREGRLIGWIYMGIIILIIYGFIQLIRYIGTIL